MFGAHVWAVAAAGLMVTGFAVNEMTHGGMAEAMGLGHHHAFDFGGTHCAGAGAHAAPMHGEHAHLAHGNASAPHTHCARGQVAMAP